MQQLVSNRWFSLADLILVLACAAVLYFWPQLGGWPIIIALLPWLVRLVSGKYILERTFFVFPLALFILTAGMGVWAAYDQPAAWEKFWIILAGAALFAALVSQPKANLGVVAGLVGIMGVIIAIIFILNHDWNTPATDLGVINRAGGWIMAVRPSIGILALPQNFVGGVLAMLVPIPFAYGINKWKKEKYAQAIIFFSMVVLILIGIILTSSRGAWLALFLALLGWVLWRASIYLSRRINQPNWLIYLLLLLLILLPVIWIASTAPEGIIGLANRAPGLPSGESRLELFESTTKLIGDFPFTGGGLRSFAGLYSQYIRVTPYFLFSYSHNFYLDVLLEQGFIGGFVLLFLILGSAWILVRRVYGDREDLQAAPLSEAVLIGILVLLIHGLIDDPLYGDLGTPLLLLLPGLALMLVRFGPPLPDENISSPGLGISLSTGKRPFKRIIIAGVIIVIGILVVSIFNQQLISKWFANLGAVEMAREELENWPLNEWNTSTDVNPLIPALNSFNKALAYNPNQRTALHRRGLIAMQNRDFETAQTELEKAHRIDPEHRGIQKSLGYAYAWGGKLDKSTNLLSEIQEAEYEMGVYSWWWGQQDRGDLARQAGDMEGILHELILNDPDLGVE
ncbi:O-antigen ligase family protein [Chloroflexota bacterium]